MARNIVPQFCPPGPHPPPGLLCSAAMKRKGERQCHILFQRQESTLTKFLPRLSSLHSEFLPIAPVTAPPLRLLMNNIDEISSYSSTEDNPPITSAEEQLELL